MKKSCRVFEEIPPGFRGNPAGFSKKSRRVFEEIPQDTLALQESSNYHEVCDPILHESVCLNRRLGSLPMIENPGHKILFIDDDPSVRRLFERYSSKSNYYFVCADDGQEGLALAAALAPDIVITDLYMPGVDGFRVLESLSETHPDTPVVVLSGAGDLDAVIRALRLGAWDYLRKPLEKMELLDNTLAKALERSRLVKENRRYRVDLEKMVAHKTAEIQTSELRFQTMADFAYDWECWLSPEGEVIYSSPSCERITGYSAAEFQAHPELIVEIVHVEDRQMVAEHTSRMALPEETCQLEFRIVTRSGETRWICHNCRPVHDARGNFQGRRMSNRDITQRKRFEGDLEQQKMELMAKSKHGDQQGEFVIYCS
jgi:PAS domain S-box-containing protein